jgi:hypothetical protein
VIGPTDAHRAAANPVLSSTGSHDERDVTFREALHSGGPAAERAEAMALYGRFVGAWDGTLTYEDERGRRRETSAEVHFGWVLNGKAVQDVWIAPARSDIEEASSDQTYGTTIRVYDPRTGQWRIEWLDPGTGEFNSMMGRAVGAEIVQEYTDGDVTHQWVFSDITDDSFRWTSRDSHDKGATWHVRTEYRLHRRADPPEHVRARR